MSQSLNIAQTYFKLSNQSDMNGIASLLSDDATYYSANLGFFLGKKEIITMQRAFHDQYQSLRWTIDTIDEIKPNIVAINFSFNGVLQDGSKQTRQSSEHILVYDGVIRHIAVGL